MSFSKLMSRVVLCTLLLWSLSIAGNHISSDLKGDEEVKQNEQTTKTFRDGNILDSDNVQINTNIEAGSFLKPGDVNSADRTFRKGDIVHSTNNTKSTNRTFRAGEVIQPDNVQINTDGTDVGNFLRPIDVQSDKTFREGDVIQSTNVTKSTDRTFRAGDVVQSGNVTKSTDRTFRAGDIKSTVSNVSQLLIKT